MPLPTAPLFGRCEANFVPKKSLVARICSSELMEDYKLGDAILITEPIKSIPSSTSFVLAGESLLVEDLDVPGVVFSQKLGHLEHGDVIVLSPSGTSISVMFKKAFATNSFLVTERCNCNCVMCSQPPKDVNDDYLADEILEAIPLLPKSLKSLGITGGEPTLLGDKLREIIDFTFHYLPNIDLQILTNGRRFSEAEFANQIAGSVEGNVLWAIPFASDLPHLHNYIMQAHRGFDETIRGIYNLAKLGSSIELRFVIHNLSYSRLAPFAEFVSVNFPFVDHVALMGLEPMGHVKMNADALWIDPVHYGDELASAARTLEAHNIPVSIYNHQLCTVPSEAHKFCVKSISEWKNHYLPACAECRVREKCGGFFASSDTRVSEFIRPVKT